jgi:hypothetical protein
MKFCLAVATASAALVANIDATACSPSTLIKLLNDPYLNTCSDESDYSFLLGEADADRSQRDVCFFCLQGVTR